MFWGGRGYGTDPRLEKYDKPATSGLNEWIVAHPIRAPVTGFVIAGALFAISHFAGILVLSRIAIPVVLTAFLLLVFGLVRKAVDMRRREQEDEEEEPPAEEWAEVDERARQQAVARWKARARREARERRK